MVDGSIGVLELDGSMGFDEGVGRDGEGCGGLCVRMRLELSESGKLGRGLRRCEEQWVLFLGVGWVRRAAAGGAWGPLSSGILGSWDA